MLSLFIEEIFCSTATGFMKLSLFAFYWRLFSLSSIRLAIKIMITCVVAWLVARVKDTLNQTLHEMANNCVDLVHRHHIAFHSHSGILGQNNPKCYLPCERSAILYGYQYDQFHPRRNYLYASHALRTEAAGSALSEEQRFRYVHARYFMSLVAYPKGLPCSANNNCFSQYRRCLYRSHSRMLQVGQHFPRLHLEHLPRHSLGWLRDQFGGCHRVFALSTTHLSTRQDG